MTRPWQPDPPPPDLGDLLLWAIAAWIPLGILAITWGMVRAYHARF